MLLSEIKSLNEAYKLPDDVVEYIDNHCSPYLDAVRNDLNRFMYRGVSRNAISKAKPTGIKNLYIVPGHYAAREPLAMFIGDHHKLNDEFTKHFGKPFRNGLFVTGSFEMASYFGDKIACIFPMGQFAFCWSSAIADINSEYGDLSEKGDRIEKVIELLPQLYQTTDLVGAIRSQNEIMLYGDQCLMYVA